MPGEDTTLKIILEDQGGQQPAPKGPSTPGGRPQLGLVKYSDQADQADIPPPPPPPPGTTGAATPDATQDGINAQLGTLSQSLTNLTSAVQATTPESAGQAPAEDGGGGLGAPGARTLASFGAAIGTKVTGSATIGGLAGVGAGSLAAGLSALGPVGMGVAAALAAVTVAGTALVESFKAVSRQADVLTTSIRDVSPDVMQAEAIADIRMLMLQMGRAQRLGPALAERVTAKSNLDIAIENLRTEFMEPLLPMITSITENITLLVQLYTFALENLKALIAANQGLLAMIPGVGILKDLFDKIGTELERLRRIMNANRQGQQNQLNFFFDQLLQPNAPAQLGAWMQNMPWPQVPMGGF